MSGAEAQPPLAQGTYQVSREKIREYALALGETRALYFDPEAARSAGFDDVVAPPMFVAVYAAPIVRIAYRTPALGIDLSMLVHGSQEFTWSDLVVAGDELQTSVWLLSTEEKRGARHFRFQSISIRQGGETVCEGEWLNIERAR
jgi:acyl dehydratase